MKKILCLLMLLVMVVGVAAAHADGLTGELTIASRYTGVQGEAFESIIEGFKAENPGVKVENQTFTDNYEDVMKVNMSGKQLPDVFMTHGWSIMRYKEYLLPLNDEPWAKDIVPGLFGSIMDTDGKIYVLPNTNAMTGVLVQNELLKELGLEIPKTVEEFLHCCQVAKEKGYIGVYCAGKDTRSPAYVLNLMAPSFLLNSEDAAEIGASLQDGTFDWNKWAAVNDFLMQLKNNGYLNVDCATADTANMSETLIAKESLFIFQRSSVLIEAWDIDPEADLGFIPMPAKDANDEPYLVGGESQAFGIWKDSKNIEAAKAFLAYMARPENIKLISEVCGEAPGLQGVEVDSGNLTPWFEAWANTKVQPWFDRVYLPSGMWAIMRDTGSGLIGGETTIEKACETMKTNYDKLRAQK